MKLVFGTLSVCALMACSSPGGARISVALRPAASMILNPQDAPPELFGLGSEEWPEEEPPAVFKSGERLDTWGIEEISARFERHLPEGESITIQGALALVKGVREELAGSPELQSDNALEIRRRIDFQLARLAAAFQGAQDPDGSLWSVFEKNPEIGLEDWKPGVLPEPIHSDLVWFADAPLGEPFALVADVAEEEDGMTFSAFYTFVTEQEAIEIRTALSVVRGALLREYPIEAVAEALAQNDAAWRTYLQEGYSQYPWELMLNSLLVSSSWDDPPKSQFVFLHPEPGILIDLGDSESAELGAALLVHGLGYLRYLGEDRAWFVGLSATLAIPNESNLGLGYGGTLHIGGTQLRRGGVPHVSLGVFRQEGTDDLSVALTVDAWRLFQAPDVNALRGFLGSPRE